MSQLRTALIACIVMVAAAPAHAISTYTAEMSGLNENPENASPATGFSTVTVDGNSLGVDLTWSDLTAPATVAHIHCCTTPDMNVGVAVNFPGFPAVTSGAYQQIFDLLDPATYTMAFIDNFGGGTVAGARAALLAGLDAGLAYTNIHNSNFPGGEIRGNLQLVPEPASLALLLAGLGAMGMMQRRRSRGAHSTA